MVYQNCNKSDCCTLQEYLADNSSLIPYQNCNKSDCSKYVQAADDLSLTLTFGYRSCGVPTKNFELVYIPAGAFCSTVIMPIRRQNKTKNE